MCWNWQSSLITWVIALVSGIYLIHRRKPNDITLGILILVYSSMQLFEALMWLDQKCGKLNRVATNLAYYALWAHVLAIGIGLYIEQGISMGIYLGIALLVLAVILQLIGIEKISCSKPGDFGHLDWSFNQWFYGIVFITSIALAMKYIKPKETAGLIVSLFVVSYALSLIFSQGTAPSFWCWSAAAFSFLFIYIN